MRYAFGIALLLSLTPGPRQLPQPYNLQVTKNVESREAVRGIFMPAKCDAKGNIYFRSLDGQRARAAVRTLKKVGPDGKLAAKYSFEGSPELANLDAYDFAVSPDGRVYATAAGADQVYLVEFSEEGAFKSKTRLEHLFKPTQLTAFKAGEGFLISGVELDKASDGRDSPSFTAVFSPNGRIAKEISAKPPRETTKRSDEEREPADSELANVNTEVEFGIALTGEDGLAYLLRQSTPAVIYVISAGGEVVRTLRIDPDRRYLDLLPQTMHLAEERLLLMFADDKERIFQVVDAQSGEILEEYFPDASLGGALACYTGKELVFLTTKNGKLQLTFAERGALAPPK